jgi:hypothetical protein
VPADTWKLTQLLGEVFVAETHVRASAAKKAAAMARRRRNMFINIIRAHGFKSRALRADLSTQNQRTGNVHPRNRRHHLAGYSILGSRDFVMVTDGKGAGITGLCRLST